MTDARDTQMGQRVRACETKNTREKKSAFQYRVGLDSDRLEPAGTTRFFMTQTGEGITKHPR